MLEVNIETVRTFTLTLSEHQARSLWVLLRDHDHLNTLGDLYGALGDSLPVAPVD